MENNPIEKQNFLFLTRFLQFLILLSFNKLFNSQEITSLIWIGGKNFRYVNFANYSNGDMIVETSSNLDSQKRMFYGLKTNGEYFFTKKRRSTPFYSLTLDNANNFKFESINFIPKVQDTNKEYLMSISSMNEQYCELYDFEENKIISFANSETTIEGSAIALIENNNYIIFAYWSNKILNIYKMVIK